MGKKRMEAALRVAAVPLEKMVGSDKVIWGTWEWSVDLPFSRRGKGRKSGGKAERARFSASKRDISEKDAAETAFALCTRRERPENKKKKISFLCEIRKNLTWLDTVQSIALIDTIDGFWTLHDCLQLPSKFPLLTSYYLFRKTVAPMWEHEANRRGGKWVITNFSAATLAKLAPDASTELDHLVDEVWLAMCLACIGEQFPGNEEDICGVSVSRRSALRKVSAGEEKPVLDSKIISELCQGSHPEKVKAILDGMGAPSEPSIWKVCVWTRFADNKERQLEIGQFIRKTVTRCLFSFLANRQNTNQFSGGVIQLEEGGTFLKTTESDDSRNEGTKVSFPEIMYMRHRDLAEGKKKLGETDTIFWPRIEPLYMA